MSSAEVDDAEEDEDVLESAAADDNDEVVLEVDDSGVVESDIVNTRSMGFIDHKKLKKHRLRAIEALESFLSSSNSRDLSFMTQTLRMLEGAHESIQRTVHSNFMMLRLLAESMAYRIPLLGTIVGDVVPIDSLLVGLDIQHDVDTNEVSAVHFCVSKGKSQQLLEDMFDRDEAQLLKSNQFLNMNWFEFPHDVVFDYNESLLSTSFRCADPYTFFAPDTFLESAPTMHYSPGASSARFEFLNAFGSNSLKALRDQVRALAQVSIHNLSPLPNQVNVGVGEVANAGLVKAVVTRNHSLNTFQVDMVSPSHLARFEQNVRNLPWFQAHFLPMGKASAKGSLMWHWQKTSHVIVPLHPAPNQPHFLFTDHFSGCSLVAAVKKADLSLPARQRRMYVFHDTAASDYGINAFLDEFRVLGMGMNESPGECTFCQCRDACGSQLLTYDTSLTQSPEFSGKQKTSCVCVCMCMCVCVCVCV